MTRENYFNNSINYPREQHSLYELEASHSKETNSQGPSPSEISICSCAFFRVMDSWKQDPECWGDG
jgi:hypothetical protein